MMNKISLQQFAFFLLFIGLSACSMVKNKVGYTKNWSGTDIPGHTNATFTEFNGKQVFDLKLLKKGPFYFKYSTNIQEGKLHFTLKSSSQVILSKDLQGSSQDSIRIENVNDESYSIILQATEAAGMVDFRYAAIE